MAGAHTKGVAPTKPLSPRAPSLMPHARGLDDDDQVGTQGGSSASGSGISHPNRALKPSMRAGRERKFQVKESSTPLPVQKFYRHGHMYLYRMGQRLQRSRSKKIWNSYKDTVRSFYSSTMMNPVEKQLRKLLQFYRLAVSTLLGWISSKMHQMRYRQKK